MSHIHIPDGILDYRIWVLGWFLTILMIGYSVKKLKNENTRKLVPRSGVAAALMLIGMSVPLFIVPVHLSLAVLIGILVGPHMGFLIVFIVNTLMAFFGHGGITVIGLNTLVIGTEVIIGVWIFRKVAPKNLIKGTVLATVVALLVSVTLMFSVVSYTVGIQEALPHHDCSAHEEIVKHDLTWQEAIEDVHYFFFRGWWALLLIFVAGIFLETFATVMMVKYLNKTRPHLLFSTESREE